MHSGSQLRVEGAVFAIVGIAVGVLLWALDKAGVKVPRGAAIVLAFVAGAIIVDGLMFLVAPMFRRRLTPETNHASDPVSDPVPVLEFSDPEAEVVGVYDLALAPMRLIGNARIWRVKLSNTIAGSNAANTSVALASSMPALPVLPVDLHRFHDDERPYDKRHNVRYGEPLIFDVIARDVEVDRFYLWRSDLPPEQGTYVYTLSPNEKKIVFDALLHDGLIVTLRAVPDPPATYVEQSFRVFLDSAGRMQMAK